jgi:outer membrane receptor protein involved in Fe transport
MTFAAAVSAAAISQAAAAQEVVPAAVAPPSNVVAPQKSGSQPQDAPATSEQSIVVTGTRLPLAGFSAPTPTTVVGKQEISEIAPASADDIVSRLPSVRLTAGNGQSQRLYASGVAPVDLRGLGPERTLTLVDGERFTPTTETGTVDANIIPVGLLQRVDVVTGGASAAYGSDAVAGVVNFILDTKLDGIRGSAQEGFSQYNDDFQRAFSIAGGTAFAGGRGHVLFGADYARNEGTGSIYSRPWGRRQPYLVANGANRAPGVPAQSFATDVTYSQQSVGGLIISGPLAGTAFGPAGVPYQFEYGKVLSTLMIGGKNPMGNPNGNPPLLLPNQRRTALFRLDYDVSDSLSFYAEGNYGYTESTGATGFYQGRAIIGLDNPFLPEQVRSEMVAKGISTITVGKLMGDYGGTQLFKNNRTLRGIAGLNGNLFDGFTWDANVQYGKTHSYLNVKDVVIANFLAASDVVLGADGTPQCAPLGSNPNLTPSRIGQVQPGCVPLNIFGLGSSSIAAQDYITGSGGSKRWSDVSRFDADLNLRGSPFATWAGPVQVAVGGEYRKDSLAATANPLALAGAFNAANYLAYSGSVKVGEGYAEAEVPLAVDTAFAKSLHVNGAVRATDYSTSGWVVTWKVGGTWEPVDGILIRGTRSRDIRAPSLNDLYAVRGSGGIANITNPFNGVTGHLNASGTGNLNLVPERADTTTIGAVLSPKWGWTRGLRFSVDYYNIKINDAIATVGATDVILRCYQGQAQYCDAITFDDSSFGIANVNTQPFNVASILDRGVEAALDYRKPIANVGTVGLRARVTRTLKLQTTDQNTVVDRAGALQSGGVPKWTGTADLTFSSGGFLTTLESRFFSRSKYDATLFGPEDAGYDPRSGLSVNTNRFPGALYLNLYAEYSLDRHAGGVTFFGKVENLTNRPPALYAATTIVSGGNPYDLIGRRFLFGIRVSR